MTIQEFCDLASNSTAILEEKRWEDIPIKLCRYNTEQVIDRIVIQVRGEQSVTIHTADASKE